MSDFNPFVTHFIEEALKKQSLVELYNNDFNKAAFELSETPVSIVPRIFNP
jgi:hypothetical protein